MRWRQPKSQISAPVWNSKLSNEFIDLKIVFWRNDKNFVFCVKILTFCEAKDGFVFPALTNETDKALRNKFDLKKKKETWFQFVQRRRRTGEKFLERRIERGFLKIIFVFGILILQKTRLVFSRIFLIQTRQRNIGWRSKWDQGTQQSVLKLS